MGPTFSSSTDRLSCLAGCHRPGATVRFPYRRSLDIFKRQTSTKRESLGRDLSFKIQKMRSLSLSLFYVVYSKKDTRKTLSKAPSAQKKDAIEEDACYPFSGAAARYKKKSLFVRVRKVCFSTLF